MVKEQKETPEKSGAEVVLESLGPRFDTIEKMLKESHSHREPKENVKEKTVISSDGKTTGSDEEGHRALKQQHPDWEFCPFCDKPEKLPTVNEPDPRLVPGPDNRPVKCGTCGKIGLEKYERCPGCAATDNFDYTD